MKKRIQHIIYFVFALLAVACSDSFEQDVDVQSGFREVAIQLNLESIEQETVTTRAGEAETKTYHLLVFDKNDRLTNYTPNTPLTEKIKVQVAKDAKDSKVVVAKCTEPPATLPIGSEYKDVINKFSFEITQGFNETDIPLWGVSDKVDLTPETPPSPKEVTVELVHAAALIQVQLATDFETNSETGLGFKIDKIYLVNYNKDGYVAYAYDKDNKESIHSKEDSKQKKKVKSLTSTTTSDGTNSSHQIWVPEMTVVKDNEFRPFLLIAATVNCPLTGEEKPTYYKVDFLDKSNNSLDIKRNTKYILTLNRVTGVGFHIAQLPTDNKVFSDEDWEELQRNANNVLEYTTTEWDISFTDIWFDQKYYFGVSTASLIFSNLKDGNERTFEIQTNVPQEQIKVELDEKNINYTLSGPTLKPDKTDIYVVTITYDSTKGSDVYENSCIISVPNTCFVYKVKLLHQSHLLNLVEAEVHLKGTYVAEKPLSSVEPKHEIVLDLTFSKMIEEISITASTPKINGISFTGNGDVIEGKATFTLQGEGKPEKIGVFDIPIQIEGLSDISFISRLMVRMEVLKEGEIPPIKVCFVTNAKRGDSWYKTEQIPKMLQQESNYGPNGEFARTKKVTVDGYLQIPENSKEHYHILFYKSSPTPLEGAALEQEVKPLLKQGGAVIHCSSGIGGVDIKEKYPNYFFYDLAVDKNTYKNRGDFMTPVFKNTLDGIPGGALQNISFVSESDVSNAVFTLSNVFAQKTSKKESFYEGYMLNHFTSAYMTYMFSLNIESQFAGKFIKNIVKKEVHLNHASLPAICTIKTTSQYVDEDLKEGLKGYVWIANPLIMGGFGLDYFHIDSDGKPLKTGNYGNSTFTAKLLGWAIRHVAKNHKDINGANRVKKAIYKGYLFDYTDTEASATTN